MVCRTILIVILGTAMVASCGALDIPPFPSDFESRCLLPGVTFLQDCTHLLEKSLEYFGLDNIETLTPEEEEEVLSKMDGFIESGLGKPDMGCCKGFCAYNNAVCSCEPVARNYTSTFFGGERALLRFLGYYASECGTKDLYEKCPENPSEVAGNVEEPLNNCAVFEAEEVESVPAPEPEFEDGIDDLDSMLD